jgi:hypothetical protein
MLQQVNAAVVSVGTIQHAAIGLNEVDLLSDANTRVVVDASTVALGTLRSAPDGWRATVLAFIAQVRKTLDADGQGMLGPYLDAARLVVEED